MLSSYVRYLVSGERYHVRQEDATDVAHDPHRRDLVAVELVDVLVVGDHRGETFVDLGTPVARNLYFVTDSIEEGQEYSRVKIRILFVERASLLGRVIYMEKYLL